MLTYIGQELYKVKWYWFYSLTKIELKWVRTKHYKNSVLMKNYRSINLNESKKFLFAKILKFLLLLSLSEKKKVLDNI